MALNLAESNLDPQAVVNVLNALCDGGLNSLLSSPVVASGIERLMKKKRSMTGKSVLSPVIDT